MCKYDQGSVGNPAVGHDFTDIPNYADGYRLLSVRAQLATSAIVATRYPHFQFVSPSGQVLHEIIPQGGQAASLTYTYDLIGGSGSANEGSTPIDSVSSLALPDLWFPHGTTFKVVTTALDAGDQWSGIYWSALIGDEWHEHRELLEALSNIGG